MSIDSLPERHAARTLTHYEMHAPEGADYSDPRWRSGGDALIAHFRQWFTTMDLADLAYIDYLTMLAVHKMTFDDFAMSTWTLDDVLDTHRQQLIPEYWRTPTQIQASLRRLQLAGLIANHRIVWETLEGAL